MGNTNLCTTVLPCLTFTTLYLAFLLLHLSNTLAINSPSPYKPVDNIILNCGSSDYSTALDGRTWTGDVNSKFFPQELSQNQASLATNSVKQSSSAWQVPYTTARLSVSPFIYIFPLTTGQKFVRLYFYPATYSNFDRSNALFSVKAGTFTLLRDFNASLTADADGDPDDTIFREFCIDIVEDLRLNITFTPRDSNSLAFINGIEILSMPSYLYYTPSDDERSPLIGEEYMFSVDNRTALETIYRINVGGNYISPTEDTGMFRSWSPDEKYLTEHLTSVLPVNTTIELMFTKIPPYTAPEAVYRTARTMGLNKTVNKMYNLNWEFPVDSGFYYLVRLHFCEFQPETIEWHDRVFLIFIANQTAEKNADVIVWSGSKGVPVYKDYAVAMFGEESEKKKNLSIAIKANPDDSLTSYSDAILNGIEIFKVSEYCGNLAGPNPDPLPSTPPTAVPQLHSAESTNNRTTIIAVIGGVTILLILGFLIFRLAKRDKDFCNSTQASGSTLPCSLCRYFSLTEIIAATNNFDKVFIIGAGGFGDVYKGYVNGGATPVAIKRLKPGSQQGAQEFKTEIEMLSQCYHNGKLDQIVDPSLKDEIEPECLKKFGEIVVNCLLDNGTKRLPMNDVVGGLELALELQESAEKDVKLDLSEEIDMKDVDEQALVPMSDVNESDDMIFSSSGKLSSTNGSSQVTVVSRGSFASKDSDGLMSPRAVFSEIMDPKGR